VASNVGKPELCQPPCAERIVGLPS
jgi:hypothetical protein